MKKIIYTLVVLTTLSLLFRTSELSESDKQTIRKNIALHNAGWGLKYKREGRKINMTPNPYDPISTDKNTGESTLPYNPNFDPDLTYEKFMDYTKKMDMDPLRISRTLQ